jgi:hypothetical protein
VRKVADGARPCPLLQARAHDGRRHDRGERAGQSRCLRCACRAARHHNRNRRWFSTETGEPDRLYLLPQDPDCRPRRKQASARLATHRPRSGGALLELRRQPKAALPARANWTNIFGYRLDLMGKSCLNPPYVVGVSCFCRR